MRKEKLLIQHLLLAGPKACIAMGLFMWGLCALGVGYNIYMACDGEFDSIADIGLYWTSNETLIMLLGAGLFLFFLWVAYNSKKLKQRQNSKTDNR